MKRKHGSFYLIGLSAALSLCFAPGLAGADDIAWDLVSSTSQNLVDYSTDAPVFSSPGDGFQKFTVGVSPTIPFALVDDTNAGYPPDEVGVVDAATDFDEFFGVVDTENDDNTGPVSATWIFDISSAPANLQLHVDLAAMGNFELEHTDPFPTIEDSFVWTYQIDSGTVRTFLTAVADENGSLTYTMADGTTRDWDDPLVAAGTTLANYFQTFSTIIPPGSQLTVVLTVTADGGSESYGVRNILVTASDQPPAGGGDPIPTLSMTGVVAMVLMLMAGAVFLFRRLR